ncbi:DUF456 domain-containing protein [Thermocoleostomius sinensis]|jgi:uncharacterized protein YqgC (DUF456 family)|uniref:DUF456 family protein n=1 Tax=Thermocoleostomius sinensis A174 TaxID=2016057 RepID=A0A9E8Z964_9CYAN|nr:DUF456 family protein [Thermocoleostomius sinensis]WAL58828.1 DUF456 family protein [Thermocoleostomius sinensis A174]
MVTLYWFLVALMAIGVIGAFVPGIPGSILIVIGIIVWGFTQGFAGLGIPLTVALLVFAASIGIDFLAAYWGVKQAGGSQWGQIGAIVGLLLGVFGLLPALPFGGPLLGLLIGPLLGAIIGELLYRRDLNLKVAAKSAIGIVVGSIVGKLIEGLLAVLAMAVFVLSTWSQVVG